MRIVHMRIVHMRIVHNEDSSHEDSSHEDRVRLVPTKTNAGVELQSTFPLVRPIGGGRLLDHQSFLTAVNGLI